MNSPWQVSMAGLWSAGVGAAVLGACASAAPPPTSQADTTAVIASAQSVAAPTPDPGPSVVIAAEPPPSEVIAAEPVELNAGRTTPAPGPGRAREPRSTALIATEVVALERLLAATHSTAPDRPVILKRLGDEYAELAVAFGRDGRAADEQSAHRKAVERYTTLKNDFPSFNGLDDALYSLGSVYLALGERDGTRKAWFELIQKFPQSKLLPNAYAGFGDLFFEEAASDPSKLALAKQAYLEVSKYPPPDNTVWGYAHYKLGWVYFNLSDFAPALVEFGKVVEFGSQYPTVPGASALAREAGKDLVRAYARAGRPEAAWNFLRRYSGDTGNDDRHTVAMISLLGKTYQQSGQSREAMQLIEAVATSHGSAAACQALSRLLGELHQDSSVSSAALARTDARVRAGCGGRP